MSLQTKASLNPRHPTKPRIKNLPEGRVVVAVGAKSVTFPLRAGGPGQELKVVQRTLELFVDADVPVLGQIIGLVALGAMQTRGFGLDVLHVAAALAAPRVRLPRSGKWGKGDFEELVHGVDGHAEVLELELEDLDGVL